MKNELSLLTPIELLMLQKHLKLGKKHLQHRLTEEEISYLLNLEKINPHTKEHLAIYAPELVGNVSLALNSIFTAILGAWSGISGLLRFSLSLSTFFTLLTFCTLIGGWIGFNHYKLIKKTTQDALEKEKRMHVEIQILKNLNQQRQQEITAKIGEVQQVLQSLNIDGIEKLTAQQFNDFEICLDWLNQAQTSVKKEEDHDLLLSEIEKTKELIQEHLLENKKRKEGKILGVIRKLGQAPMEPHFSFPGWLKANFRKLIVSLTPVIFGGFSSLFVYVGGAPKLAEDTGLTNLSSFLSLPEVKYVELAIVTAITLYFSLAVIYVNRQAYLRDQELAKTEALLTKEETKLDLLDDKLLKIKQIMEFMKPIESTHRTINTLTT